MTTATAPKLTRPIYHVFVAPEGVPVDTEDTEALESHRMVITAGDQLRAELEAKRQGLGKPSDTPMHLTLMWIWAAMVRTGATVAKWQVFQAQVAGWEPERDPADPTEAASETVDPTAASTS